MRLIVLILFLNVELFSQSCENGLLVPDYGKIQYAGSIGMISFGPGYYLFDQKVESELMFGFTPVVSDEDFYNLTWKVNYKPFKIIFNESYSSTGIYLGIYNSFTIGENYWVFYPDKYPAGYYNTLPGLRTGIYLGTSITKFFGTECRKGAEFFFECGTYERLLMSYWSNNKIIPFVDIIKLGLGVKIDI